MTCHNAASDCSTNFLGSVEVKERLEFAGQEVTDNIHAGSKKASISLPPRAALTARTKEEGVTQYLLEFSRRSSGVGEGGHRDLRLPNNNAEHRVLYMYTVSQKYGIHQNWSR